MNGSRLLLSPPFLRRTLGRLLSLLFLLLPTLLALFFLITGSATLLAAQEIGLITNVRTLATEDATRVVISLSRPIRYQLTTEPLASDQRLDTPPTRLDITFSSATLASSIPSILRVGDALVTAVHSSQMSPTTAGISLELTGRGTYRALDLRSPYQVVIVLRKVSPRLRQEPEPQRQERKPPPQEPELSNQNLESPHQDQEEEESPHATVPLPQTERRYRIMLDPGHGGHDPGARGLHGIWEKNVVLAISKRLAKKLQERLPVEVMLTRSRDVFISLPGRTARANAAKADLFISIHANASPNSETHGIETYYLNNTNDRATLRLAKLENRSLERGGQGRHGNDLALILSDLIQTGKSEESIALARAVQRALVNQARTHYPDVRNLGVKKGPFYVLVGAHMPCVLVETAFLSHTVEGKHLGTSAYQEALAEGLFQGIARFLRDDAAGNL